MVWSRASGALERDKDASGSTPRDGTEVNRASWAAVAVLGVHSVHPCAGRLHCPELLLLLLLDYLRTSPRSSHDTDTARTADCLPLPFTSSPFSTARASGQAHQSPFASLFPYPYTYPDTYTYTYT
jgi:hypothetical protein